MPIRPYIFPKPQAETGSPAIKDPCEVSLLPIGILLTLLGFAGAAFLAFADALIKIAEESKTQPELLHEASHITPFGRMDEGKAARELALCCWLPEGYEKQ